MMNMATIMTISACFAVCLFVCLTVNLSSLCVLVQFSGEVCYREYRH